MNLVHDAFAQKRFILDLDAQDVPLIFHRVVRHLADQGIVSPEVAPRVEESLIARENEDPTAIGHAVAVPHAYVEGIEDQIILFVRLARPVNLGSPDGIPTRYLFFLLGPPGSASEHLDALAEVARLMSDVEFRYELGLAITPEDLLAALEHFHQRTAKRKPAAAGAVTEGLTYTGKFCGGLRRDVARRLPHYWSDLRDGLHTKCIGSTLFLFFACRAGGHLRRHYGRADGKSYRRRGDDPGLRHLRRDLCAVFRAATHHSRRHRPVVDFHLVPLPVVRRLGARFSSRPRLGGPVDRPVPAAAGHDRRQHARAVFHPLHRRNLLRADYDHLHLRGHQVAGAHLYEPRSEAPRHGPAVVVARPGDVLHRHEPVAVPAQQLSSAADAGDSFRLWADHRLGGHDGGGHLDERSVSAPAAGPGILRADHRRALLVGRPVGHTRLGPLRRRRTGPAGGPAGLLGSEHHRPARQQSRSSPSKGRSLSLGLGPGGAAAGGLFAVRVALARRGHRPLAESRAQPTVEEVVSPSGETRERVIHVRENRLTPLAIHLFIGLSLLLLPLLKEVPMAVLYGLFLFMGVVSMSGNQYFERLSLWFKDTALYPVTHYIRRVPRRTIHAFTLLQTACLGMLWLVKSTAIGILFPVFVALLVPVRLLAGRCFAPDHLAALDAEEEPEEEETHWAA